MFLYLTLCLKDGDTPLCRAAYWGYKEVVTVLVAAGANLNISNKVSVIAFVF